MSTKLRPDEAERERAGGRVVVVLVLGLALLAGGGYAAAYAGAGTTPSAASETTSSIASPMGSRAVPAGVRGRSRCDRRWRSRVLVISVPMIPMIPLRLATRGG